MTHPKNNADFIAIRKAALDDLLNLSDKELADELVQDGVSLQEISRLVGEQMRETAALAIRRQKSKGIIAADSKEVRIRGQRPSIAEIKKIITQLFENAKNLNPEERSLGLAFREGKKQTDSDWESLYEDLVRLKAIRPKNDH